MPKTVITLKDLERLNNDFRIDSHILIANGYSLDSDNFVPKNAIRFKLSNADTEYFLKQAGLTLRCDDNGYFIPCSEFVAYVERQKAAVAELNKKYCHSNENVDDEMER